ncbi:nucleotide exchange factor GrpE [Prauserella oleivorans]|uniref:Protein GrpE n=1 Tax=Prauserella oleivorans TaxID=1478153 RepID=A0ABW5WHS5_9PSEU
MTERYDDTEAREQREPVVVRDRRKIDPETGELRKPEAAEKEESNGAPTEAPAGSTPAEAGAAEEAAPAGADLEKQLEERTADLQRVQAEYANYRRRVDRDREQVAAAGKASLVNDLLPLLDDLERAEQHGDLTGAFKAVADKLVGALERAGLEAFGKDGEPFDPSVHEAVQHSTSPDVTGPTVSAVLRRGYRFGDRVLRAALVAVTDHEPAADSAPQEEPIDPPVGGELPVDTDEQKN